MMELAISITEQHSMSDVFTRNTPFCL